MIYLDNAATTFPKPAEVYREVGVYLRESCGSPGRGGHRMALAAAREVWECRCAVSELFGLSEPERVCFAQNCTCALNIAIKGVVRPFSRVITSNLEHNSVLRPLYSIPGVKLSVFNALKPEEELLADVDALLTAGADALVCTHASNILPVVLPVGKIGEMCAKHGTIFIVDAAQSAGVYPIDIKKEHIDILCMPGHKSLYGLQGSGAIVFSPLFDCGKINPLVLGGSGVESKSRGMPELPPERFEAGTLSTPTIVGLHEGIKYVKSVGIDAIREKETALAARFRDILLDCGKITVYGEGGTSVLFNIDGIDSEDAAQTADKYGVCVRAGFHCSPAAREANGTFSIGAVRASFSYFNTMSQAERAGRIFRTIAIR